MVLAFVDEEMPASKALRSDLIRLGAGQQEASNSDDHRGRRRTTARAPAILWIMPYRVATADGLTGHTLFSLRVEINLGLKKGYTMSALQLQSAGLEYARNVREFQREISDANMSGIERQIGQVPGEDEAARSARWHRQNIEQMERHNRYQEKFRAEFRADGVLLYEELLRRTGETKHSHLVALEHGMLAGASPLEEVAQEIEKLSKKLSITPLN